MNDFEILAAVERALRSRTLRVGGGETVSLSSALIALTSVNKGFLFPRMTSTQRDAITNPVAGLVIFNTTTGVLNFHNGSAWGAV